MYRRVIRAWSFNLDSKAVLPPRARRRLSIPNLIVIAVGIGAIFARGGHFFAHPDFYDALALCAASSKTDQTAIAKIIDEHGQVGFLAAWLRFRGASWAADLIPNLTNMEMSS